MALQQDFVTFSVVVGTRRVVFRCQLTRVFGELKSTRTVMGRAQIKNRAAAGLPQLLESVLDLLVSISHLFSFNARCFAPLLLVSPNMLPSSIQTPLIPAGCRLISSSLHCSPYPHPFVSGLILLLLFHPIHTVPGFHFPPHL